MVSATAPLTTGMRSAQVSALLSQKFPIAPGFVIAAEAFAEFVDHNQLDVLVHSLLSEGVHTSQKELGKTARAIQKAIRHGSFPDPLVQEILRSYIALGEPRVMIFPSFGSTDSDDTHHVGAHPGLFGYQGDANLFDGIRELWSEFFATRPLYYRIAHGRDHFTAPCSILIQKQPRFSVTGQLFTSDPTAQQKQAFLIKAVYGEQGLTGDLDDADYYWCKRGTGDVYKAVQDKQTAQFFFTHGDLVREKVPTSKSTRKKLSPLLLASLAKLAARLQQTQFFPQRAIFGIDGTTITLVHTEALSIDPASIRPSRQLGPVAIPTSHIEPKVKPPQVSAKTSPILGLSWNLSAAGHLPKTKIISGRALVSAESMLTGLFSSKVSVGGGVHYLHHALRFFSTQLQPAHGILFTFDSSRMVEDRYTAVIVESLKLLRTDEPSLAIGILVAAPTAQAYAAVIERLSSEGLPRSSRLSYFLHIQAPSIIWEITACVHKGLDGVVVQSDRIARLTHDQHVTPDQSPATIDMMKRIGETTAAEGIRYIMSSSLHPHRDMLTTLQGCGVHEFIFSDEDQVEATAILTDL